MCDKQFADVDDDDGDVKFSVEATDQTPAIEIVSENVTQEQVQRRTFSHWPHGPEFTEQIIDAGFFGCNTGDRVICLQCNCVYEHWIPHIDDPSEVHRITSPNCPYVQSKLIGPRAPPSPPPPPPPPPPPSPPLSVINGNLSRTVDVAHPSTVPTPVYGMINCDEIVLPKLARNPAYAQLPARNRTFHNWNNNNNSPSIDDLVRAGFFYSGTRNIVTCFYCTGSLHNWRANADPMVEHARHFPNCGYARQLCGHQLYQRIKESKRLQQERLMANRRNESYSEGRSNTSNLTLNRLLLTPDDQMLSRLVAARLALPISQKLLNQKFRLAIIRRAWEDQLRLKESDFVSDLDLHMACLILQKQIEFINGNRSNIITPSVAMSQNAHSLSHESNDLSILQRTRTITEPENSLNDSRPLKTCLQCHTQEAQLACIPCGHLVTCARCRYSLAVCPACQREIKAFVRIYL